MYPLPIHELALVTILAPTRSLECLSTMDPAIMHVDPPPFALVNALKMSLGGALPLLPI